jgi:hypothetical protein
VALPVYEGDNSAPVPNSLLKILCDLFSRKETAAIFFTNDLKVLIDIILREVVNLDPTHEVCVWLSDHISGGLVQ